MGRRGIKEYRANEALALIAADRDHERLVCPSCGSRTIVRVPRRRTLKLAIAEHAKRITLTCRRCERRAVYIARGPEPPRDETLEPTPTPTPTPTL